MNDFRFYPVVIVGGGYSLTDQQCNFVANRRAANGCRVIVVNNAYRKVPNADILYAADFAWWKGHHGVRAHDGLPGVAAVCPDIAKYSCEAACIRPYGTTIAKIVPGRGIAPVGSTDIQRGSGGGFQATGLALSFGARKVILIGMDCKPGPKGEKHWHPDHPAPCGQAQPFSTWSDEFTSLAGPAAQRGLDIVDCSLDSAIRMLRKSTIEKELVPHEARGDVAA